MATAWLVGRNNKPATVAIYCDSRAALQGLKKKTKVISNAITEHILQDVNHLANSGCRVTFSWVPAHVGISGNERADVEAKNALAQQITLSTLYTESEVKSKVKSALHGCWQESWTNTCHKRFLGKIKKNVRPPNVTYPKRNIQTKVTKLRLGTARFAAWLHKTGKLESASCPRGCGVPETTEHVLLHCAHLEEWRPAAWKASLPSAANGESRQQIGQSAGADEITCRGATQMAGQSETPVDITCRAGTHKKAAQQHADPSRPHLVADHATGRMASEEGRLAKILSYNKKAIDTLFEFLRKCDLLDKI
jgi:ribonuclease HI